MADSHRHVSPIWHEYAGNLHIHTKYSDGSGDVDGIAAAAASADLDFVGINDHDGLQALLRGEAGYRHGVLVIAGTEVNRSKNHYLAYGVERPIRRDDDNPRSVIDEVRSQGGFGVVAHPHEKGSKYIMGGRTYPWDKPDIGGFDGICIWNMLSQWRDAGSSLLRAVYYGLLNPGASLTGPPKETLAWWDECCLERKVVAIGGSDAHGLKVGWGPLKLTLGSYAFAFRCVNVRVLTSEPLGKAVSSGDRDARIVLEALRHGRTFISLDLLGSPEGFRFTAGKDDASACEGWQMGDTVPAKDCGGAVLRVRTPDGVPCRIRLIRDGAPLTECRGSELAYRSPGRGAYRVEVDRLNAKGAARPWIFSNPIWLGAL